MLIDQFLTLNISASNKVIEPRFHHNNICILNVICAKLDKNLTIIWVDFGNTLRKHNKYKRTKTASKHSNKTWILQIGYKYNRIVQKITWYLVFADISIDKLHYAIKNLIFILKVIFKILSLIKLFHQKW